MSKGIIFYNYGLGSIARMAVAIYTLRKHYNGEIAILSDDDVSDEICKNFEGDKRLGVRVIDCLFDVRKDRNHHYLSKCRVHELSPFDVSLYIDSDTVTVGDMTPLLDLAEKHEFVTTQFSNWRTDGGGTIPRRIRQWREIKPRDVDGALSFGPAINTGVFAFVKNSGFMLDWFKIARKGRKLFIPDETSCQLVLWKYKHKVAEWWWNASCKYDNLNDPLVRLIHFHGRKHCRNGLPFNGEIWVNAYRQVAENNIANIMDWTPGGDRRLRHYLKSLST